MSINGYIVSINGYIVSINGYIVSINGYIVSINGYIVVILVRSQWIHSDYICRHVANSVPTLHCLETSILGEFSYT